MMAIENPKITINELVSLEKKVEDNSAIIDDYRRLEAIIKSFGLDGVLYNSLKEYNVLSMDDVLRERKKPINYKNPVIEGSIIGVFSGIISVIKSNIK